MSTGRRAFFDTGYFVARAFPRDQWHAAARQAGAGVNAGVTSSLVINETITLMRARGFFSLALDFLRMARDDRELQISYVDPVVQSAGWDLFARYGPTGATAVDCTSFVIMKQLSIKKAFTFDRHFESAGFETLL